MEIQNIIAVIIFAGTLALAYYGIKSWRTGIPTQQAKACPPPTTTAGTTPSSTATSAVAPAPPAPATTIAPTTPAPTPASAARVYNFSWVWPVIAIAALAALAWFTLPILRTAAPSPASTVAPKTRATKVFEVPLRFVSGEKIQHANRVIRMQPDGIVHLEVEDLPKRPGTRYWIKFSTLRKCDGSLILSINGNPPKILRHLASSSVENKVFDSQDIGTSNFREGKNFLRFSAPGAETELHSASIEAEWME